MLGHAKSREWFCGLSTKNVVALMTTDKTTFFQLVDAYARTRYGCFLAEMDLRTEELGYTLCFRPQGMRLNSPTRYACKYLLVPTELVRAADSQQQLPSPLVDQLDAELSKLKQQIADAEGISGERQG